MSQIYADLQYIPGQLNSVQVILVHRVSSRDSQICTFTHRWKGDVTRFKSIPNLMLCDVPNLSNEARNNMVHPKIALFWGAEKNRVPYMAYTALCSVHIRSVHMANFPNGVHEGANF